MPGFIDSRHLHVDELPGVWSPVQWEMDNQEQILELETQATASLLWSVDVPETLLRLLLDETEIERLYEPPMGYDSQEQGEWDPLLVTFGFKRALRLERIERKGDILTVMYEMEGAGHWLMEFSPERVMIERA